MFIGFNSLYMHNFKNGNKDKATCWAQWLTPVLQLLGRQMGGSSQGQPKRNKVSSTLSPRACWVWWPCVTLAVWDAGVNHSPRPALGKNHEILSENQPGVCVKRRGPEFKGPVPRPGERTWMDEQPYYVFILFARHVVHPVDLRSLFWTMS
jgi:hypothetical protein